MTETEVGGEKTDMTITIETVRAGIVLVATVRTIGVHGEIAIDEIGAIEDMIETDETVATTEIDGIAIMEAVDVVDVRAVFAAEEEAEAQGKT